MMKLTRWIGSMALLGAVSLIAPCPAVFAVDTFTDLADWEVAPTGAIFPDGDFDPNLDNAASCSGCWFSRTTGTGVTYSQSTGAGTTSGTHALQATLVGKGNGGQYSPVINGARFGLDTHFDYPLVATYTNSLPANGGVLDSRFTAIEAAIDSPQAPLYSFDFDITYDVAQMRSIPWQPPEETVFPGENGENRYPQRFFWVGMYGNANDAPWTNPDGELDSSGFQFTGFDANTINPFDAQWDNNLFPVFHASFPLTDLTFQPNSESTFYSLGILYNSVFGTLPASGNTAGVNIYFDNFRMRKFDPVPLIDFNNSGVADPGDWELFMIQYGVATPPTAYDLMGSFGAAGKNGAVDFHDLRRFQQLYDLAQLGSGSVANVPEPSTIAMVGLFLLGLVVARGKRFARPVMTMAAGGIALALTQQAAQAQLIEGFETIGNWQAYDGADPYATPITVGLSSNGATEGTNGLKVTQGSDTLNTFSWNAATSPNWTTGDSAWDVLSNAVRIGAEHYNLLADVTFDPAELIDQGVNVLTVTLGLNFRGQTIGSYVADPGVTTKFTTTATILLSDFNLPDMVDHGATGYSAQIGFTGDNPADLPYSAHVDNIRLEQISMPDLLTLEIDRSNGAAILKNLTANPISWDYLEIKSDGASLDVAGWNSLDDQNADGAGIWLEAGGSSATGLVEASLFGSHTLPAGETLPLGNLYNELVNVEDVGLMIRKAAGPSNRTYDQNVTYFGIAPPMGVLGDYNGNNVVDAADYVLWRNGGPLQNEVDNPGTVNAADYTAWRSRFGNTAGSGSSAQVAAVPEPATWMLILSAVVWLFAWNRRGG